MKKHENTLILNSSWELIVYIISVLSIFRAPSLHSRTNWEQRRRRTVKRSRRETSISNADLSQEISCTWEAPETHFRQLKNSQSYTVKTLYPVIDGVIKMWRQRGKKVLKSLRDTCALRALPQSGLWPSGSFPLSSLFSFPRETSASLRASFSSLPTSKSDYQLQRQILSRVLPAKHVNNTQGAKRGKALGGTQGSMIFQGWPS